MMRLETGDKKDWQGFTRILEVLSLLDEIQQRSPQEIREAIDGFCELPPNPGDTGSHRRSYMIPCIRSSIRVPHTPASTSKGERVGNGYICGH